MCFFLMNQKNEEFKSQFPKSLKSFLVKVNFDWRTALKIGIVPRVELKARYITHHSGCFRAFHQHKQWQPGAR